MHITRASTDSVILSPFVHGAAQNPPNLLHCVAGVSSNELPTITQKGNNMRLIKSIITTAAIGGLILSTGCASINKAPIDDDKAAKEFNKDSTMSQVYIYRNESFGGAVSMPVTVDGKTAGNTGPKSFFKFNLPEGNHVFTSQGDKSTLAVDTKNGEQYFIWQEVKMGAFSGGSLLQVVPEGKGKKGVSECRMIQSEL